jgi:CubicO group peptidase (beta-lactamase class C family)
VVRWNDGEHEQTEPITGYRREVRRFDSAFDRFPVEADPRKVGVEPVLLDRLVLGAETARSDGLLVLADGKLLAGRTFGGEDDVASVGSLPVEIAVLAGGESDDPDAQRLRPSDLAALGQALVDGKWTGEPVVSEPWRQALALPAVDGAPGAPWAVVSDPNDGTRAPIGFKHVTDQGEGLLFFPEAHLVVVRTMHRVENGYDRRYDRRDGMEWLDEMSEAIVVEKLGLEPRHK